MHDSQAYVRGKCNLNAQATIAGGGGEPTILAREQSRQLPREGGDCDATLRNYIRPLVVLGRGEESRFLLDRRVARRALLRHRDAPEFCRHSLHLERQALLPERQALLPERQALLPEHQALLPEHQALRHQGGCFWKWLRQRNASWLSSKETISFRRT